MCSPQWRQQTWSSACVVATAISGVAGPIGAFDIRAPDRHYSRIEPMSVCRVVLFHDLGFVNWPLSVRFCTVPTPPLFFLKKKHAKGSDLEKPMSLGPESEPERVQMVRARVIELSQRLYSAQTESQMYTRERKRRGLTVAELDSVPPTTLCYRSVGECSRPTEGPAGQRRPQCSGGLWPPSPPSHRPRPPTHRKDVCSRAAAECSRVSKQTDREMRSGDQALRRLRGANH